jgi:predicted metalloprotease
MNTDNTGLTLMTVIAHEFGHILQHERGYLNAVSVGGPLKAELNADFLSGYFLGTRKLQIPSLQFQKAGDLLMRKAGGDHGTPQQRLNAAEAGFRVAYVEKKSVDDAVQVD